jgi:hypothetical protein
MKPSRITLAVALTACLAGIAMAAPIKKGKSRSARSNRTQITDLQRIDINNINMVVKNTGSFAYDTESGGAGLEFPKGTGKTAVFAAGLWMGALVGSDVRVSVSEYSDDYKPGGAPGGVPDNPNLPEHKVYKLNRVYLDASGNVDVATRDAVLADYTAGAVPHGAPAVTVLSDGSLSIIGDQMLWSVYNDFGKGVEANAASSNNSLGVEIQQTTFAFSRQGPLGNTVFMRYRIINRGTATLTNAYVSQWSDPDLGGAVDDLVGCDTTLSVGFVYNATNNDEQYGAQSPAVGYDFLQGPRVGANVLGLASFNAYPNGGGPQDSVETYNYMKGLNGDGTPLIDPITGQPTPFNVSGDPVTGTGFLDSAPSDRRLMLSSGPFTMAPGDTQEVVVGIVVAQGTSRTGSIALMKCFDEEVQRAYDANFDLPNPPNTPQVTATPRDGEVVLRWDSGSEASAEAPYEWEGYNVYQGASIAGPFTRIATFDRVNGVTSLLDIECDPASPVPLPKVKAFGTDFGVQYVIELDEDVVRGNPLHSGTAYYYAVTSYATADSTLPHVLESPFNVITVVPQSPPAGVDLSAAGVSQVDYTQLPGAPGAPTTDIVSVIPVEPEHMIDAAWTVGFKPATDSTTVWYVVRTVGTDADTVVNNWPNVGPDENFPIVDGIQVKVLSYPLGELARVTYEDTTGGNPAALVGDNVGLPFFDGGAGYAKDLFGSSVPSHSVGPNIEVRFGAPGQLAYRYVRCACSPRTYLIQDFVQVPWTVWNLDTGQQLNAGWLENEPNGSNDGVWNPETVDTDHRELIWPMTSLYTGVLDSTYFGVPDSVYGGWVDALGGEVDFRYVVWPDRVTATSVIDDGDKFLFTTSVPSNEFDQFAFTTTKPVDFVPSLASAELSKVRAVPNPYFAHSTYEINRFNRVLKFTHLPAVCTIRIFNLAGDLVRTIQKDDPTSQASWDLNTKNGLPVGSGIYIFHVDAPGAGTVTGKVAVFMEKERLNNF